MRETKKDKDIHTGTVHTSCQTDLPTNRLMQTGGNGEKTGERKKQQRKDSKKETCRQMTA